MLDAFASLPLFSMVLTFWRLCSSVELARLRASLPCATSTSLLPGHLHLRPGRLFYDCSGDVWWLHFTSESTTPDNTLYGSIPFNTTLCRCLYRRQICEHCRVRETRVLECNECHMTFCYIHEYCACARANIMQWAPCWWLVLTISDYLRLS